MCNCVNVNNLFRVIYIFKLVSLVLEVQLLRLIKYSIFRLLSSKKMEKNTIMSQIIIYLNLKIIKHQLNPMLFKINIIIFKQLMQNYSYRVY